MQRASATSTSGGAIELDDELPIEERVTILWRGEGPDDLPRRGRDNGPVRPFSR